MFFGDHIALLCCVECRLSGTLLAYGGWGAGKSYSMGVLDIGQLSPSTMDTGILIRYSEMSQMCQTKCAVVSCDVCSVAFRQHVLMRVTCCACISASDGVFLQIVELFIVRAGAQQRCVFGMLRADGR